MAQKTDKSVKSPRSVAESMNNPNKKQSKSKSVNKKSRAISPKTVSTSVCSDTNLLSQGLEIESKTGLSVASLEVKLENTERNRQWLIDQLSGLEKSRELLIMELSLSEKTNTELSAKLKQIRQKNTDLSNQNLSKLNEIRAKYENELDSFRNQIKMSSAENAEISVKLKSAISELQEGRAELEQTKTELEQTKTELSDSQEKLKLSQSELNCAGSEIDNLKTKISSKDDELAKLHNEREALNLKYKDSRRKISDLKFKLANRDIQLLRIRKSIGWRALAPIRMIKRLILRFVN